MNDVTLPWQLSFSARGPFFDAHGFARWGTVQQVAELGGVARDLVM